MFEDFWNFLKLSGETIEGDKYSIADDNRLHIQSIGNTNKAYFISKETVERYFTRDIPNMSDSDFRQARSAYFLNVYNHYQNRLKKP